MNVGSARPLTLRARHVVSLAGPPLENAWLRIRHGRIVTVGSSPASDASIDLGDAVILPGLVNAHTHLEFSSLQAPLPGDGGLPEWIGRVVALRRTLPADAAAARVAAAIDAGLAECAASGVTTIGEIATAVRISAPAGPRIRVFREALGLSGTAIEATLAALQRDLDRLGAAGAFAGVSPHAPYSVSAPLGRRMLETARRRRLPAAMHLAESPAEAELIAHGSGPFRTLLESLGAWPSTAPRLLSAADWISLLARGPRGLVVHGTFLDDDALARFARHRDRLAVAVCPRTTRLLSGALPPVARFRAAGIRVALGTDSRASTPDLSVLAECRALVEGGLASPAEALHMATVDGAWALGFDRQAGMLAPGRPADLVILRPARPFADPHAAALDPDTTVVATIRAGRLIHGQLGN
ncbi:MAG: amidohydrolase family protein [Planctomycetia bacterium]